MKVAANTLRKGMVVEYNDKLWVVMSNDIRTPGKGASVAQVVMRDIVAGTKTDIRFATQDMVERARVETMDFQFRYTNDGEYTVMNNENFEQIVVNKDVIGEPAQFLQDGMIVEVQMHEGRA